MALQSFTITAATGDDYTVAFTFNGGNTATHTLHVEGKPDLPTLSKAIKQYYKAWRAGIRAAGTIDATVMAALAQAQAVAANDPDAS